MSSPTNSPTTSPPPGSAPTTFAAGALALLASACCLGPLVLVSLGLGGAWVGNLQALSPFRPLFLAGAAVALAVAGRRIFRRAPACAPGVACPVPATGRTSKILFVVVALLVLLAAAFPSLISPAAGQRAAAPQGAPPPSDASAPAVPGTGVRRTVTLAVTKMTCAACPITVRTALLAVPGVTSAEVSFERQEAVVTFDEAKTSVAALTRATADAGYPSSLTGEAAR